MRNSLTEAGYPRGEGIHPSTSFTSHVGPRQHQYAEYALPIVSIANIVTATRTWALPKRSSTILVSLRTKDLNRKFSRHKNGQEVYNRYPASVITGVMQDRTAWRLPFTSPKWRSKRPKQSPRGSHCTQSPTVEREGAGAERKVLRESGARDTREEGAEADTT